MKQNSQQTALYDLSSLGIARVRGNDAGTFLQGQLSNDILALEPGAHQLAAYCTPKGRMLAIFHVLKLDATQYALLAPREVLDKVLPRLKMFVMRSAVDISLDEQACLLGATTTEGASIDALDSGDNELFAHSLDASRYLILAAQATEGALLSINHWNLLDIQQNLPQVFLQTHEAFIPQTLNLDIVGGVNFKKGCYPGQEIIARVKYRGKPKTRMIGVALPSAPDCQIGMPIFISGRDKFAGLVANIAHQDTTTLLSISVPVTHLDSGGIYLDESRSTVLERLPAAYEITV